MATHRARCSCGWTSDAHSYAAARRWGKHHRDAITAPGQPSHVITITPEAPTQAPRATPKLRPPVEGMPSPRPRCQYCDKPLAYMTDDTHAETGDYPRPILRRVWTFWRGYCRVNGVPLFCTLNHARLFAWAAWEGGYRVKRG